MTNFFCMFKYLLLIIFVITTSCVELTPEEKIIKDTLGKTLNINMFKTVKQGDNIIPFNEFRRKYNFISVIYLEDSCTPCYPKYIDWINNMESITNKHGYTVLFIIKGHNYENFLKKIKIADPHYVPTDKEFYVAMDHDRYFLDNNRHINKWSIERSLLINAEDKVKLIGSPFNSPKMKELFNSICKEQ